MGGGMPQQETAIRYLRLPGMEKSYRLPMQFFACTVFWMAQVIENIRILFGCRIAISWSASRLGTRTEDQMRHDPIPIGRKLNSEA